MYHVLRMPAGDWPEPVQRAHLEMMARRLPQGRYLHCPDGSHLAMYDDQQVYFAGLIDFLRTLWPGSRRGRRRIGKPRTGPPLRGYAGQVHVIVEVGSQLDPDVSWPEGAALTMFDGEPAQLMIFLRRPHQLEIEAVTTAPTQFAWVDSEHAGVLLYRLGPILSWSQVPYTPHLFAREDGLPGVDPDPVVQIVLVDTDSNTVKALHKVRWPDEFADTVRASVTRMRDMPFSRAAYEHVLAGLHRRYPTPEDLVTDRTDAHCTATPLPHYT